MKSDKKPVIGLICVMACCIFVIALTLGLLASVHVAGSAADSTADADTETPASEPELEWGYKFQLNGVSGREQRWLTSIAYKSDKRTFNIDEVKLTLSFGSLRSGKDVGFDDFDIPEFKIYYADKSRNNLYTVRNVQEDFTSEEFGINIIYDVPNNLYYYEFNHSEEITIPKEIFTQSEGIFTITIGGMNYAWGEYVIIDGTDLEYRLVGDNEVVLSPAWVY
ncbi:MAG: hypothetical protein J1F61_03330 [Clostridiales bacterium]|nr:hypothetical protein [Clostridiales bacterium]